MERLLKPGEYIETERLILRPMRSEDKHAIFLNLCHDRKVLEYFVMNYCETEEEYNIDRSIEICSKEERNLLAVCLKSTGEVMGMMLECSSPNPMFNSVEIGYALGVAYHNKGYCTEAASAFTKHLLDSGVHKVFATYFLPNTASARVMQKIGMHYAGVLNDEIYYRDKYWDLGLYYILSGEEGM